MGKVPVRLKEVTYTLSPYHQHIFSGLFKDVPYKLSKKFHENWVSALTLITPIVGTYMFFYYVHINNMPETSPTPNRNSWSRDPLLGADEVSGYAENFKEKEKLHHRY